MPRVNVLEVLCTPGHLGAWRTCSQALEPCAAQGAETGRLQDSLRNGRRLQLLYAREAVRWEHGWPVKAGERIKSCHILQMACVVSSGTAYVGNLPNDGLQDAAAGGIWSGVRHL